MGFWFKSFFLDLAVAVGFPIFLVYLYAKYKFNHWARSNIEYLEPSFPFGNTTKMILRQEGFGETYTNIYKYFKKRGLPYGGYFFMLRPDLMIVDPDIVKQVLVKDFEHFVDRGTFSDEENDPLTAHLFNLNGTKWKNLRANLTPAFTPGKIKMMFPILVSCSDELKNILEEKERLGEPMDIKDYLARFTIDVIGNCAFGIDCNCLKNPIADFRKYGQLALENQGIDALKQICGFLIPGICKSLKIRMVKKKVSDFFMGVVKETVEYREKNSITRDDFVQLLIQLKNTGKLENMNLTDDELTDGETQEETKVNKASKSVSALTIEQMAAQCFVFFLAGFEASSSTMTFCLYELVRNPEIQDKVRREINTVLAKHGDKITYEAIMEMHYMDKVINETMRKYPVALHLTRQCTKDYPLPKSNHVIRKGEMIIIPILGLHSDPDYYPDPFKFDPERFSSEEHADRNPYTFLPFGEGPRICIGLRFGLMQVKVGLSVLLKNYSFTLNSRTKDPVVMDPNSFILSTLGGIWLDAHKVKS